MSARFFQSVVEVEGNVLDHIYQNKWVIIT
jgi:hypothetical protein